MAEAPLSPENTSSKKKKSPWLYVGIGCLVFVILGIIGITALAGWGAKKVVQISKEATDNPEKFAAELIVKAHPEIELVTSDPKAGLMTIRNKESGKETTFSYKDIANGKFDVKQDSKEVSIETKPTGEADNTSEVTIKEGDTTTTLGSAQGTDKLPDWIPVYPAWTISSDGGFHVKSDTEASGSISGTTKDAVGKVSGYYKNALEKAGFKCEETNASVGDVEMSSVSAKNESLGQEITVNVLKDKAQPQANVTLVYQSKKK